MNKVEERDINKAKIIVSPTTLCLNAEETFDVCDKIKKQIRQSDIGGINYIDIIQEKGYFYNDKQFDTLYELLEYACDIEYIKPDYVAHYRTRPNSSFIRGNFDTFEEIIERAYDCPYDFECETHLTKEKQDFLKRVIDFSLKQKDKLH